MDIQLFSIGDVAGMFNLSVGSLRHYEEIGLLIPEHVDENSGYRYYSVRQFEALNTIRYLRALDMPLKEIADFLSNRDVSRMKDKLLAQKKTVLKKEAELKRIERKIDNRLKVISDAENSSFNEIKLANKPACRIVRLSNSLKIRSFLDMEEPIRRLEQSQKEAVVFLGKVGVGISAEHLKNHRFDCYDEIFLLLDDEDNFDGKTENISETLCMTVRFHGSHTEAPEQYSRLTEYAETHDLKICGFSREITMIDYGITHDTDKFVTEIGIPVVRENK